jgi:hypothetical protein
MFLCSCALHEITTFKVMTIAVATSLSCPTISRPRIAMAAMRMFPMFILLHHGVTPVPSAG